MRCECDSASSHDSWNEFIYLSPSQLITYGSAARWAWRDSPAAAAVSRNEAIDQKNESYSSEKKFNQKWSPVILSGYEHGDIIALSCFKSCSSFLSKVKSHSINPKDNCRFQAKEIYNHVLQIAINKLLADRYLFCEFYILYNLWVTRKG